MEREPDARGYTLDVLVEDEQPASIVAALGGEPLPRSFEVMVVAQDPSVRDAAGGVLTATVRVPADRLEPGPRTHRFHVVDYDAGRGPEGLTHPADFAPASGEPERYRRLRFDHGRYKDPDEATILADRAYHALNAWAIAARTLAAFESALGRRVPWGFNNHQLYIVPHAFAEANAYYADDDHALLFGYFDDTTGRRIHTCLSHDIVAHETTHAVLDGLRRRLEEPGLPDQAAFHEAFADIVALLSVFSTAEVVERLLGQPEPPATDGTIPTAQVGEDSLTRSPLFTLAEQLGSALRAGQGGGLRRSVALLRSPQLLNDRAFTGPHRRGEVLVAAVMQTLLRIWLERLRPIARGDRIDLARAAEEGTKSAEHLLRMAIRAIDYCPPLEIEFGDFLDAMLVADMEVVPDDLHGYRAALTEAFAAFGITPPARGIVDLTRGRRPLYHSLNFTALRSDPDEVYRFIWQNAELFKIRRRYYTYVDRVQPTMRIGPDGFIVSESFAIYVQSVNGTAAELRALSRRDPETSGEGLVLPERLDPATPVQIWGGGVLIFDQFGRAKYHQAKPLHDWRRQSERLAHLVRNGMSDSQGRYGFSLGAARGQRFAAVHLGDGRADEEW